jgi:hypothetical protein
VASTGIDEVDVASDANDEGIERLVGVVDDVLRSG